LPPFLVEELTVYLGDASDDSDAFVFTAPEGGPLRHNLFYQRTFRPAVRRAGLPPGLRFHDLRHTCAALLIAQRAHPKAMQERLGHSSITVTLDRYGHLFPSLDEALTEGLEGTYRAALAEFSRSSAPSEALSIP
jgi:integrase